MNTLQTRFAILSMDVEEWYHTGYLDAERCDRNYSMLDGLENFLEILNGQGIPAQLFALGEVLSANAERFRTIRAAGHEIASHGWDHSVALRFDLTRFRTDLDRCKGTHEDALGTALTGYRAPCFLLDRARLDVVREAGFLYDSSVAERRSQGVFDLNGFEQVSSHIWRHGDFFEFGVSNFGFGRFRWPTSGGGALRILPGPATFLPLSIQLRKLDLYSLYLHPIDISRRPDPPFPANMSALHRLRFSAGRRQTTRRLEKIIDMLRSRGFVFTTCGRLREQMLRATTLQAGR